MKNIRVAIVHDWLVTYAGSERVLEQMLTVFPDAELYCLFETLSSSEKSHFGNRNVNTTYLQKIPDIKNKYRSFLPLFPHAISTVDVSQYDVVISSSHAVAKAVKTRENQLHICMCYSPMRYAWDLRGQYLAETGLDKGIKGKLANWLLDRLQRWDLKTAGNVDYYIAISEYIKERIQNCYNRGADIIYPPVDTDFYSPGNKKEDFYFTASRMVQYKKIPLIVEAFSHMPDKNLIVIGDGPELVKCKEMKSNNVELLGYQDSDVLLDYMGKAKAFVFAAEEDFGIAPLEAQACGTPVIAYGKGGARETIVADDNGASTGVFFHEQTVDSIVDAVKRFESITISPKACRKNAERFSVERFQSEFLKYTNEKITEYMPR